MGLLGISKNILAANVETTIITKFKRLLMFMTQIKIGWKLHFKYQYDLVVSLIPNEYTYVQQIVCELRDVHIKSSCLLYCGILHFTIR